MWDLHPDDLVIEARAGGPHIVLLDVFMAPSEIPGFNFKFSEREREDNCDVNDAKGNIKCTLQAGGTEHCIPKQRSECAN